MDAAWYPRDIAGRRSARLLNMVRGTTRQRPDISSTAAWFALAAGCVVTGHGLWRHLPAMQSQWHSDSVLAIGIGLGLMVAWQLIGIWWRRPVVSWATVGIGLLCAVVFGLAATMAVALTLVSSYAWGRILLGRAAAEGARDGLVSLLSVAVGLALIVSALYLCGRLQVHYRASYTALLAAPLLLRPASLGHLALAFMRSDSRRRDGDQWNVALLWLGAVGLLVRLAAAVAPEVGADALSMHLYMPVKVAAERAFVPPEAHLAWAWMPMAVDWLYTLGYVLAGESASRALNVSCDVMVALLCHAAGTSAFGRRAGALAFALYACNPLGYLLTTSLFVENPWTLWLLSACLLCWFGQRRPRWLIAAACCFAAALSSKALSLFYAPLLCAAVLACPSPSAARIPTRVIGVAVLVLLLGLHPYLAAWRDTGNPVFPFLNHVFQSPLYPQSDFSRSLPYTKSLDWTFPYLATFDTSSYLEALPGALGIAWLLLLPLALVSLAWRGWPWALWLLLLTLAAWLTLRQMAYLRYLAPAFPMLSIFLSGAGCPPRLSERFRQCVAACTIFCGTAGLLWFPNATWWYRQILPRSWLDGASAYGDWIRENRPERILAERIAQHGMRRVLWLGNTAYAGYTGRLFVANWYQPEVQEQLSGIASTADAVRWISSHRVDGVVYASGESPCDQPWRCGLLPRLGPPVEAVGGARLYRVPAEIAYPDERIRDPFLDDAATHWPAPASRPAVAGGLVASLGNPATQSVDVIPGREYRLEMEAACRQPRGAFRLQVNWLDHSGALVRPDIAVESCGTVPRRESRVLVAPAGVSTAIVYATGHHPGEDVMFTEASLRTRPPAAARDNGLWRELLRDSSFDGTADWIGNGMRSRRGGSLIVDRGHFSSQSVRVRGGEEYFYSLRFRCVTPGSSIKQQVNWQDASNALIRADIASTPCSARHALAMQRLQAPPAAAMAIVYAAGNDGGRVEITDASFRDRGEPRWPWPWPWQ